jgi:hypothetical protein
MSAVMPAVVLPESCQSFAITSAPARNRLRAGGGEDEVTASYARQAFEQSARRRRQVDDVSGARLGAVAFELDGATVDL